MANGSPYLGFTAPEDENGMTTGSRTLGGSRKLRAWGSHLRQLTEGEGGEGTPEMPF